MKYIEFGCNRVKASQVVLGLMRIPELDIQGIDALLNTARDNGINFLDIADCYSAGKAESLLGEVFKKNPSLRDSFIVQSKCGIKKEPGKLTIFDFSKEHIIEAVNGSLKRMNIDHMDSLLLHRPDALMEPDEIGEAFNQLHAEGKVLSFGVSNMNPMQMKLLKTGLDFPIAANQVQLSICHTPMLNASYTVNMDCDSAVMRDGGVLEYCRLHKIVVQAWSVMQYGFFKGVFVGSPNYPKLNEVLNRIAKEQNSTPTAVAIAWVLRYPALMQAVIGTTKQHRVEESAKACEVKLSKYEWYELYLAAGNFLP
ncbi:Predicted oxidoreductase [Succinivibrio dextrinosolvens DSM 3072]|uniref:Predicted oxidoreductase n=1 Tax=Succinivibrio dextrinosolvens DSM 3072 TaxID=1123324 RepID=A0A1T4VXR6_9GAMM|nr:aldo/keto reductase [Succinivibrio dextrinosolvens]SKA69608.1 Predicted oxidoreductase [Succinivibrio dextrinosolvens DSM 3072]